MVIFESTLSHRYFAHKMDEEHQKGREDLAYGFGKAASYVLAGYFIIKVIGIAADNNWYLLNSSYGVWFLVELLGFVALPSLLYAIGVREKNLKIIKWAAIWTVFGVMINRLNVCLIAFNWHLPSADRYFPHWMEIGISIFLLTLGIIAFRVIVTLMPIFYEHPEYKEAH
jgi:Ni/Fe-hydrogenase subunit HybB-like protein